MNENFEYNESNIVFRDLILLTLTGFISMVILLMPFINPPTEKEDSTVPPGNVIVELFWDNDRDVDIDLWVQAPEDIPVGYSNQGGLFFNLLRDDLGKYKDSTPVNYEVSYSRGINEGVYVANLHLYREDQSPFIPINAKLVVSVVDPNTKERKQILKSQKTLKKVGEEITIFQFKLDKKGNLDKNSINNNFVRLRSGNKG
ncbi:MAG: hypothetical protein CFH34_01635 [Alphaproteobacteria bacterium MarineAlpha9_Bin4]|nr:MAG: hypothetical protein CFH34_01635 [Alphaproteobacteria bacterium MarineAlpha9_Bin4]|tara:strand:+ start:192 stop:794 length:603 start_codon:yes stop_codon:yes gene_type:complete